MATEEDRFVYVGTYAPRDRKGIHVFTMDNSTGALHPVDAVSGLENPSFLTIHPEGTYLYAVSECNETEGENSGAVSAFQIDRSKGTLEFLNQQLSGGPGPCHLSVDSTGSCAIVANYSGGSVSLLPIKQNGELEAAACTVQHTGSSVNPDRQTKPYAHSITPDPSNRYALAADLGTDQIVVYRLDSQEMRLLPDAVSNVSVQPGSGPRHLDFHPDGKHLYLINEIGNTVMGFTYDTKTGALSHIQTVSTLPESFGETSHTADIHVSPSGRFLYGSNRGHDSLAIFAIDQGTGLLNELGHQSTGGKTPRNFAIDPSGEYLLAANQDSDNIVSFRIDAEQGTLTPTGDVTDVPKPVCIKFSPSV